MANFQHRIIVHCSSRLCINTPRPASSWASKQASAVPLFSPLSSCESTSRHSTRRLLEPTCHNSSSRSRDSYVFDFLITRSLFRSHQTSLSTRHPQATQFHLRQIVPQLIDAARSHSENAASDPFILSYTLITELSSAGYHLRYTLSQQSGPCTAGSPHIGKGHSHSHPIGTFCRCAASMDSRHGVPMWQHFIFLSLRNSHLWLPCTWDCGHALELPQNIFRVLFRE